MRQRPTVSNSVSVQGPIIHAHSQTPPPPPPPPFFSANNIGVPYGDDDGTMRPDSSNVLIYVRNSSNSRLLMGYNFLHFGGRAGSTSLMVKGVQLAVIGYCGSSNTLGNAHSNSPNSPRKPSKATSLTCPPWADRCVKLRSAHSSINAKWTCY